MIHHAVAGGKSSRGRAHRRCWSFRGWAKTVSSVCACLLVVVGAAHISAQPGFLPPQPGTADVRPTPIVQGPAAGQSQQTAPPGQPTQPGGVQTLPPPRPLPGNGGYPLRMPRMPGDPGVIGATPMPSPAVQAEYGKYVGKTIRPENNLEVVLGQTHLMVLQDVPKRIQIGDEGVAAYTIISPTEISILGKDVGTTVLNLWFTDVKDKNKEKVLSYLVRVLPDPEYIERLKRAYKAMELDIAHNFPDSRVSLILCADKLLVCGQAKDVAEANYILDIVRAASPSGMQRLSPGHRAAGIPVTGADGNELQNGVYPATVNDYEIGGESYVVNMLKVPGEQQISLMVTVVEVDRSAARTIGVNFNLFNNRGINYLGQQTGQIVPNIANTAFNPLNPVANGIGSVYNNLPVALDNGQVQIAISALRELHYARTLTEPNLVTMNGQAATLTAGDLFPLPYVSSFGANGGLQGIGYYPVGVQLQFTPYITDKDRVRLQINAEVSDRDTTAGDQIINGNVVPILTTRSVSTVVELREGQTLAVAGLIQNKLGADASRVPFFGDLPFIGRLAAFDHTAAEEKELVILITPELVHPMERKCVPPLPGCDVFEPGDLEFYLLGRLESRRSYDFRSPVMTDFARMCKYHKAEQIYIAGPHGHSMTNEIGLGQEGEAPPPPPVRTLPKDSPGASAPTPAPMPNKLKGDAQ